MHLILYGPPGSGKTTIGKLIAARLGRSFVDADEYIEAHWQRPIPDYFERREEPLFRARETETCRQLAARDNLVIAPGGGALLNPHNRATLESSGVIICLTASLDTLLDRLSQSYQRPLLAGDPRAKLTALLQARDALYHSFAIQVNTDGLSAEAVTDAVIDQFRAAEGITRFEMGACSAVMGCGLLRRLPEFLAEKNLRPPFVVISDSNVAPRHGNTIFQSLSLESTPKTGGQAGGRGIGPRQAVPAPGGAGGGWAQIITFPAGEAHKTLATIHTLYVECLKRGLERGGTILALGGGVTGDMAGFVAATYMRGVRWVNLPTTVLAMSDASLGGKVGCDLPEGKNLVGAFHLPALVLADFDTLKTLPDAETHNGLAEVIKSAVIGDADMFDRLSAGNIPLEAAVARAAAVKAGVVNADLYERGERALLNLGHTFGHGIETASNYTIQHGEAVAVGMVAAAYLAQSLKLAEPGLAEKIAACLQRAGLPTGEIKLDPEVIREAMQSDKKKARGQLKFVLPKRIGEVVWGVEADEARVMEALRRILDFGF